MKESVIYNAKEKKVLFRDHEQIQRIGQYLSIENDHKAMDNIWEAMQRLKTDSVAVSYGINGRVIGLTLGD